MDEYNQIFYAHKNENQKFESISSIKKVTQYSGNPQDKIYRVRIKEAESDDKAEYWGWNDFENKEYDYIWGSKLQTRMCSGDYFHSAEKEGKGKVVPLILEEILS